MLLGRRRSAPGTCNRPRGRHCSPCSFAPSPSTRAATLPPTSGRSKEFRIARTSWTRPTCDLSATAAHERTLSVRANSGQRASPGKRRTAGSVVRRGTKRHRFTQRCAKQIDEDIVGFPCLSARVAVEAVHLVAFPGEKAEPKSHAKDPMFSRG